jgi:hypothetical protein
MNIQYAAGLFDGEGMVRIARWEKPGSVHVRYALYVSIGMTHRPVIEQWQEEFGGKIYMNRHDLRNKKHRIQYNWSVGSQIAADCLYKLESYLIVKKMEARIGIALQEHINDHPYVPSGRDPANLRKGREKILAERESMYKQITALKHLKYDPLTN